MLQTAKPESPLVRIRRQVKFTPDTVFENLQTSKDHRVFSKQRRRLIRQQSSLEPFRLK